MTVILKTSSGFPHPHGEGQNESSPTPREEAREDLVEMACMTAVLLPALNLRASWVIDWWSRRQNLSERKKMKKACIFLAVLGLIFALCAPLHAAFKKGYVVVKITEQGVIIKNKKEDNEISVKIAPHKFKVGDAVKYDEEKNLLKPDSQKGY